MTETNTDTQETRLGALDYLFLAVTVIGALGVVLGLFCWVVRATGSDASPALSFSVWLPLLLLMGGPSLPENLTRRSQVYGYLLFRLGLPTALIGAAIRAYASTDALHTQTGNLVLAATLLVGAWRLHRAVAVIADRTITGTALGRD